MSDKILNPKTGFFVKKTGLIGKRIIREHKKKESEKKRKRIRRKDIIITFNKHREETANKLESATLDTLHPETTISLPELTKINHLGLLTSDSQQGIAEFDDIPINHKQLWLQLEQKNMLVFKKIEEQFPSLDHNTRSNILKQLMIRKLLRFAKAGGKVKKGIIIMEKAYVVGIFPAKRAKRFIDILNSMNYIVAIGLPISCSMNDTYKTQVTFSRKPNIRSNHQWEGITHFPISCTGLEDPRYNIYPKKEQARLMNINIMDTRLNYHVTKPDGLFKKIIKALTILQQERR